MWHRARVSDAAPGPDRPVLPFPFPPSALIARMGIEFVEASAERVVATMPVEGNTQVTGLLHGGASCVLAETLGSVGAMLHVWPDGIAVGTDINATHHRSASRGLVTGTATALSLGRTLCSHEVVITDEQGTRLCTARITNLVRPLPPGWGPGGTGS